MTIKLYIYRKETKYTQVEPDSVVVYKDVRDIEVLNIPRETVLESSDEEMVDEFDEYLVIEFNNFETATYRNSHVDCFKLRR